MKKKILWCFVLVGVFLLSGCGKGEQDIIKKMNDKVNKSKSYYITGELEIINNEDTYKYDTEVSYKEENQFKVLLKNKTNNHEQIILRNSDGVYVLTPSLNKSFKFQSEWPYNSSQSYLLQVIVKDINSDAERTVEKINNEYVITTKVDYSNNEELKKQKIYIDGDANISKVEVLDDKENVKIRMNYNNIDLNATFDDNYFKLENSMKTSTGVDETVSNIDEVIFPMYVPDNTYLSKQDKVFLDNGERVILTFAGDKPFTMVQETVKGDKNVTVVPTGELEIITDSVGYVSDQSVSWISNGIEYYVSSSALTQKELIDVAKSMSVMPVGK